MNGSLSGIRVLDFSEYIAGPFAAEMLADMGAEVIKVEPPQGDFWRLTAPVAKNESRGFIGVNKGKRSISIDLKHPAATEILHRALRSADVLVTNYRPGVAARLGLDYDTVSAINPRLISCENTAFGSSGPYRERAGFDLVSQAMTGIMAFEGGSGMPHPIITTSPTDLAAGMFMAYAVASALYQRERTGRGQKIETSLFAAGLAVQYRPMLSIERTDGPARESLLRRLRENRAAGGRDDDVMVEPRRALEAARRGNPYYRVYETRDSYIALACLNNRLRRMAAEVLEVDDPRVLGPEFDVKAISDDDALVLSELIGAIFSHRPTEEWVTLMEAQGVPCAPVRQPAELFEDPAVIEAELLREFEHPVVGPIKMANSPLRMSDAETGTKLPPPALGQHTREVLGELGFAAPAIDAFEHDGVVRSWQPERSERL